MASRSKSIPLFRSAFMSPDDEFDPSTAKKPVVFDILAPDYETSLLPEGMRMVLHVNPQSMAINYAKVIERTQTMGGYVEQHWGDGAKSIDFNMATGGFMRLFSGLSNITGGPGSYDAGGTRRDTIAYDKYLDMLALFHNNGSIYDTSGKIVFQGIIKITFDGGIYLGWFSTINVTEDATKPFQFTLSTNFVVAEEIQRFRSPINLSTAGLGGAQGMTSSWDRIVTGTAGGLGETDIRGSGGVA
jgi:hypothetical protein